MKKIQYKDEVEREELDERENPKKKRKTRNIKEEKGSKMIK